MSEGQAQIESVLLFLFSSLPYAMVDGSNLEFILVFWVILPGEKSFFDPM